MRKPQTRTRDKLGQAYENARQRCNNPKAVSYSNYGGRGIQMLFADEGSFRSWAYQNGWHVSLQLDRIDTNGNYEPSNCRFVTPRFNSSNKRNTSKYGACITEPRKGRFYVQVKVDGIKRTVGTFDTPELAREARDKFMKENNID